MPISREKRVETHALNHCSFKAMGMGKALILMHGRTIIGDSGKGLAGGGIKGKMLLDRIPDDKLTHAHRPRGHSIIDG
jgi:hypothetical protein